MRCIVIEFFDGVNYVTRNCILGNFCFMVADHYDDGSHVSLYNGKDAQKVIELLAETNELTDEAIKAINDHVFMR